MSDTIRALSGGWPPRTPDDWRPLAEKALRGADLATLDRSTEDGLARGPVFFDRPEGSHAVDAAPRDLHLPWGMRQTLVEATSETANEAALADLMGGVSELELRLDPTGGFGLKANELETLDAALRGGPRLVLVCVPRVRTAAEVCARCVRSGVRALPVLCGCEAPSVAASRARSTGGSASPASGICVCSVCIYIYI